MYRRATYQKGLLDPIDFCIHLNHTRFKPLYSEHLQDSIDQRSLNSQDIPSTLLKYCIQLTVMTSSQRWIWDCIISASMTYFCRETIRLSTSGILLRISAERNLSSSSISSISAAQSLDPFVFSPLSLKRVEMGVVQGEDQHRLVLFDCRRYVLHDQVPLA